MSERQSPQANVRRRLVCGTCDGTYYTSAAFCGFDGAELVSLSNSSPASGQNAPTGKVCSLCLRKYPLTLSFCGIDGAQLSSWQDVNPPQGRSAKEPLSQLERWATGMNPLRANQPEKESRETHHSAPDLIGKTIDEKYRIDSVLAEGGMAILYKAEQIAVERTVVVKIMHGSMMSMPSDLERFTKESKLLARLNHPNIVSVHDAGFIEKRIPYLVMEYIKGMNLADTVEQKGCPSVEIAGNILMQICRGLNEAHDSDVIHRDLKPENIILQEDYRRPDWVKIVDFGVAHLLEKDGKRLTSKGYAVGTPEYIAPEILNDQEPDKRCDIYALGVVMFELLSGKRPFEARELATLMAKILTEPAPSISVHRADIAPGSTIDRVIKKCLEKDPINRFQNVSDLMFAVQTALK